VGLETQSKTLGCVNVAAEMCFEQISPVGVCDHPRDAMLARVLAMALCLSVCRSVTSRCSVKRDERINPVFGMESTLDQSYTVF